MLDLIPVIVLGVLFCSAFYYWLSRRGENADEAENMRQRRSVSLVTESLAYCGATLVLAGGGVAVGQAWADIADWERVGIFAATALFFLAIGLVVLQISEPAIQRMISVVWFVSACAAGAAAGVAAGDLSGSSGPVAVLVAGVAAGGYSAVLWFVRRRELQLIAMFAGLTLAVSAGLVTIAGSAGPRLAIALGLWVMGIGWVIVGCQYPQPLWSTVPLAIAITMIAPAIAVWQHGWVFAIGIGTAGVAMFIAVSHRRTALLGAGTLVLFGYVTSVVIRYFRTSFGLPATLAASGVLLLAFAVVIARIWRSAKRHATEMWTAERHVAEDAAEDVSLRLAGSGNARPVGPRTEGAAAPTSTIAERPGPAPVAGSDEPIQHLPKAS